VSSIDPRRRNLVVLAGIAAAALLLALLAVWRQSAGEENAPQAFFPGFAARVSHHEVAHIHIVSKAGGTVDIAFKPRSGWVIASRQDFPASFEQVNATLVGLAAMQALEKRTARADRLHYLGLDAPPKGDGVLVVASNEKGETLASLIAGNTTDIGDQTGATGLFVRRANETQSWLVRAVSEIRPSPSDWMNKAVLDVDRARIRSASMTPVAGPAYSVHRDKPSVPDFTLDPIPPGREISDSMAGNQIADALVGFSFDDAKRASELDFAKSTQLVVKTFDGLTVTVNTIKTNAGYWATVRADAAPANVERAKEARDIDARANGWAYKLADFKGQQFTTPLENLLKPKGAPAKTAP
jgi:hypothetical protein